MDNATKKNGNCKSIGVIKPTSPASIFGSFFTVYMILGMTKLVSAQMVLPNETNIFSFKTQSGKTVTLSMDQNESYLVCRFGKNGKVAMEFPEKDQSSWSKFKYSFYFRGGGKMNEGMDLNYVSFVDGNFRYVLYQTYYAMDEKSEIGVQVINLIDQSTTIMVGKINSLKGSLIDFRYNELLMIDDRLYD